ncbi:MAG: hypothetical protein HUK08_07500, partial [Bacteroidaceae bacterium]|nr:hypothetical protein [Bacteroidaceae bacterium]
WNTLDANDKAILLSGRSVIGGYVVDGSFHSLTREIMIATPATRTNNSACASEAMPMEAILGPEAVVVVSDLIGYGITRDKPTPYIFNETAGRQSYDLALATIDYMNNHGMNFSDDLKTYTCGLSQGGGYSLAVHKMMEGVFPKTGEALRFSGSLTSGGLYDLELSIKLFAGEKRNWQFGEMSALPMIYLGMKEYFPEETKNMKPEDLLNPALVKAGILEMISSKECYAADVEAVIRNTLGVKGDITFDMMSTPSFSEEGQKEGYPAYGLTLELGKRMSRVLKDWTPKTIIRTIHSEQDTYVPYENCVALEETFGNMVQRIPTTTTGHVSSGILFYLELAGHGYRQ